MTNELMDFVWFTFYNAVDSNIQNYWDYLSSISSTNDTQLSFIIIESLQLSKV